MTTPSGLPQRDLQYWGTIRGGVAQRESTAQLWGRINDVATTLGMPSAGLSLNSFNQMRSSAAGIRNSSERLAAAPGEYALDAQFIGSTPYARSLQAQADAPQWRVGFQHTTTNEAGDETTDYRSVRFTGQLPATLDDLHRVLGQDAEALADKYGTYHVGYDSVEILAI